MQQAEEEPRSLKISAVGIAYGGYGEGWVYSDKIVEATSENLDADVVKYSCQKRSIPPEQFMAEHSAALVQVNSDFRSEVQN